MPSVRKADGPYPATARELQAVLRAERGGTPCFVYRRPDGEQRVVGFGAQHGSLTIGRSPGADLSLHWDDQVSALHAVIERLASELTLRDDGLSRNGSYVNGERVHGMRRLRNGDVIRLGRTSVRVRNPADADRRATAVALTQPLVVNLSDKQRKVLGVLCRSLASAEPSAILPSNQEIADELFLSVAAVKLHLRALFEKFQITHLPQNKKRYALANSALESGLLTDDDLRSPAEH